jgi:hypothetical protein
LQIGKLVFVYIDITITTNGTGASSVVATLPVNARIAESEHYILTGAERAVTGAALTADCSNSSSCNIVNYANGYPGGSGYHLILTGLYEAA